MTVVVEGLGHRYGRVPALHDVSLVLGAGEIVALMGPSGCGKSTLLRAIAGLTTPTEGSIVMGGQIVTQGGLERVPTERRGVGLVFQDHALFPTLTVRQNIAFGLQGREPERVQALMDRLGLAALADRRPAQLSGGQQQRVGLARALAPRPAVLLLDEPFANLDPELRVELGVLLRETVVQEGAAALLVSHDRNDALSLADRLAVLAVGGTGGRVVREGAPQDVYDDPRHAEAASLTGDVWFMEGVEGRAVTPWGPIASMAGSPPGRIAVRPERTCFAVGPGDVRVRWSGFRGASTRLVLEAPGIDGLMLADHATPLPLGTAGTVSISAGMWIAS
jgi:iron(III) transport system ATP-binding protein